MKQLSQFKNKKVLVLGLARSGEAAARLLVKLGAIVTVNDAKPLEDNPSAKSLLEEGIRVITGHHPLALLDEDFSLIVKNPGIPYANPMIQLAMSKEIPIYTEVELAYLISEAPIVGITGSNGKTTTTTMIEQVLKAAGQSPYLSGNIGFPASEVAQSVSKDDILVMELSSFQLMGIKEFKPHIAVMTNIMPTHLDYHGSFDDYVKAKWAIQKEMTASDFLVLNVNQDLLKTLADTTKAKVVPFSTQEIVDGAYLKEDSLYFRTEKIMSVDQLGVPGLHNVENALATIAVAKILEVPTQTIVTALSHFSGVKHRLQSVGSIEGISFYNDSKSTNILATKKALSGFNNEKVLLIAGGLDRGNEFDDLVEDITGLKVMILIGESAPRMIKAAQKANIPYVQAKDVKDATKIAFNIATNGDTILLSPANASWDMYDNFEVRGDEFIVAFNELKGV
ncbi:UDP-N-acetylmuramoyl-L-alanine--D-glutamate ligase [Streptococcus sp. CSL10205-OR2]|uniref:UDP-N-acetylmuramoyl-L-alanine--D-glutamate ligase n=1 Tax=Streptococcus sp. CSL10205-OR2 TaxID=2980558 RepID=UPI0021DB3021|nr:UDP-N-acetylmuramoyl-L-alanine--D-glutamate ligase [Streptococcus sp. CSL10205-OR2]MCU9533460.1 UDP-N-acetylmuramoyl-L-alanine--D-glutamate ligase [Streptococcus sp. CSL10205-OR2]